MTAPSGLPGPKHLLDIQVFQQVFHVFPVNQCVNHQLGSQWLGPPHTEVGSTPPPPPPPSPVTYIRCFRSHPGGAIPFIIHFSQFTWKQVAHFSRRTLFPVHRWWRYNCCESPTNLNFWTQGDTQVCQAARQGCQIPV